MIISATVYKNIQIKSNNIDWLVSYLSKYKEKYDKESNIINNITHGLLSIINFSKEQPIKFLNTILSIDYNHINNSIIEEYIQLGSKWYFV